MSKHKETLNRLEASLDLMMQKLDQLKDLIQSEQDGMVNGKIEPFSLESYSDHQLKVLIEGKFTCEFSNISFIPACRGLLTDVYGTQERPFECDSGSSWEYCRIITEEGVRIPWFGEGEPSIDRSADVLVKLRNGRVEHGVVDEFNWVHDATCPECDIIEFVYYIDSKEDEHEQ